MPSFDYSSIGGCCGVTEIHSFSPGHEAYGPTREAKTYKGLFEKLLAWSKERDFDEGPGNYIYQIWFHRLRKYDDTYEELYEAQKFMDLIATIPGVI
jgi:hypothetical protein